MQTLKLFTLILRNALDLFDKADGWTLASHIALTALLALFPFLIFLTSLAAFFDASALAQTVIDLLFDTVPERIAAPVAREVRSVLLVPRGGFLTIGVALTLWFASSGVEALRVGLNRTYGGVETRSYFLIRLESIGFVIVGAAVLLTLALLVVLAPVAWNLAASFLPALHDFEWLFDPLRYLVTLVVAMGGLILAHLWLPAGKRKLGEILPGIFLTLLAWIIGGIGFAAYLSNFASYASTYAGLAGAMTALVFLYLLAVILLFGAALNVAWRLTFLRARSRKVA